MNRKMRAEIFYYSGIVIVAAVAIFSVPLLIMEFSWDGVGVILAALLAGLLNIAVGRFMKKSR